MIKSGFYNKLALVPEGGVLCSLVRQCHREEWVFSDHELLVPGQTGQEGSAMNFPYEIPF